MVHIYAIVSLVFAAASSGLLVNYGSDGYFFRHFVAQVVGVLGFVAVLICSIVYFSMIYQWFAAEQKANILNREYGSNYTQAEIFFASDVINTVRELDRKRIEINGDFRRERDLERNLPKPDNR